MSDLLAEILDEIERDQVLRVTLDQKQQISQLYRSPLSESRETPLPAPKPAKHNSPPPASVR